MIFRGLGPARMVGVVVGIALILVGLMLLSYGAGMAREKLLAKVAIVVGPVGSEITPVYLELAEQAAREAEARGATVARAYSPDATPENVKAAVDGASIVIYL